MAENILFRNRVQRLRGLAASEKVDGLVLTNLSNIRYFCGFSGSEGLLLVEEGRMTLLVDGRYTTQARQETSNVHVVEAHDIIEGLSGVVSSGVVKTLGFEAASLTYEKFMTLCRILSGLVEMVPITGSVGGMRVLKDAGEIGRLKKAAAIAARALATTLASIRPGMRERECAARLDWSMVLEGSEKPAFDTIIASGANGALPHARPGDRSLEEGDFIVIDYGAVFEGYHSDETCTVALGRVTGERRLIYETVRGAHDRAVEAVKPGVLCRDIDACARTYIEEAGFGSYFVHATGHGVGLDVHEAPKLSGKSEERLQEGMVVTIEPGIYIPGVCGVRIEDTIVVTAEGCEIITATSKELMTL